MEGLLVAAAMAAPALADLQVPTFDSNEADYQAAREAFKFRTLKPEFLAQVNEIVVQV